MSSLRILIVDDEKELRESLFSQLTAMGHRAVLAATGEAALSLLQTSFDANPNPPFDLVLLDVHMPGQSGLAVLAEIKRLDPAIFVLIITAHGNIRDAVEAMRLGAYNYLEKPVQGTDLVEMIDQASEAHRLVQEVSLNGPEITLENGEQFVGASAGMKQIFQMIARLGSVNTNVLIRGENGTGKELVARAIHFNSTRKDAPFVAVNCAAIPETLIESELFGHERGAFTGADQRHIGKFQYAEGGTLFLDEIGDISPAMQVKLLRVLQERKFMPVGSNREIRCDLRIVTATNRNLEELIAQGRFRQDLYYRLNVMPIQLPPLRDRKEDLRKLVNHFVEKFNELHGRTGTSAEIKGIREEALDALKQHHWPGNVRELENVIERAFVFETSSQITIEALPEDFSWRKSAVVPVSGLRTNSSLDVLDFHDQKERFERDFIVEALRRHGGKINQTVAQARIPKNTLLRKMRKYGITTTDLNWEEEA